MTVKAVAARSRLLGRIEWESLALGLGVVAIGVLTARMLTEPRTLRLAVVGVAVVLTIGFSGASPKRLIFALIVWLTALGFLRRTLNLISPTPQADPLLLVAPLAIGVLFLAAANNGAFRDRSRLASAVLALNVISVIGAFNPLQGNLATGFGGLLFVLVPTLAFWVGRGLCDEGTVATALKVFAVLSIPAAIYGLEQTFAGFPSWDRVWIAAHKTSYAAISQNGVPRAFGSFSAASEYATFLAIGVIVWIAFGLRPVLAPIALGAIGTLVVALFYEGSRGSVIATVAALALMTGVRAGVRLKWSLALGAILILVLPYVVTRVVHPNAAGVYSTPFVTRQVEGLQNPTNPTVSTLPSHIKLLKEGLSAARAEPLGRGTGAITIAGAKFGGTGAGTEADPSDVAVAFGLPGLLIYIVIAVECIRRAYRLAFIRRRSWVAPAALAIIVATALQWLNGGQYAVAFLPWLLMGWVDRSLMERPPPPPEPLY